MRRLLHLVLSASLLAITACDKPRENPAPSADSAQLTPTIKITKYSQSTYKPCESSLYGAENQDPNQFSRNEQIKPVWPYQ